MQATYVQQGDMIDYTPVGAVTAGTVVVQGNAVGVAGQAIPAGVLGALAVHGIFNFVKDGSEITAGASLYWDADGNPVGGVAGTGAVTTTAGGNTFLGWAVAAAAAGAATVTGRLSGGVASVTANHYGPLNNVIADPGNAGAIDVTASGVVALVSTAAQTRTLAAPTFAGQELSLGFKTDGGDIVVACATFFNLTGNNRLTFAAAGEFVRLQAVESGVNLRWRVVGKDGGTFTTV
jgi:predicted RecA/RadA family phage recombinase